MKDLISRQAAIDAIFSEPLYKSGMKKKYADEVVPAIYEKIKSLSSEQPEQPEQQKGKWVDDGDPLTLICDKCGYRVARYNNTDFCPNCGNDKRGAER